MSKKTYLGDGVYVDHDGYHLVLTTEDGNPEGPSNIIYLEPEVMDGLIKFDKQIKNERENTQDDSIR
jgi:hypothetical protein